MKPWCEQGIAIKARAINCHPILVRPFPTPLHLAQANPARARCTLSVYLLIFVSTAQTISVITDTQLRLLLLFGKRTQQWAELWSNKIHSERNKREKILAPFLNDPKCQSWK